MRHSTLALVSFVLASTGFGATSGVAQEEYRDGYLSQVEPGVTLQRATEVSAEEAVQNLPFLPGDRVWTDAAGRVEFQFPDGTVVRLDSGSKLDYSDHDESRDERVVLRLWSGSLILRARTPESAAFDIETPGGLVQAAGPGVIRVDVEGGETQLSVYEGEASLDTGPDQVRVAAGQRTWARWGDGPAEPVPFDRYAQDGFAAWDGDLESRQAWAANSRRYLPQELEPYAPQFDTHGTWIYEEPVGYVWQPRVAAGWAPYSNGRWSWTSYGWTWVPYEPWGWAPHHYGRWGFSVSVGWYWAPGSVWGPGWVNWGVGGGYVGWCALGPYNRPVVPWPHHRGWASPRGGQRPRGHAVPRGSVGHGQAWTVVRDGDLGRGGYAKRRVDPSTVGGLRVAESAQQRPDRGVRGLTASVPRAASARPRVGASSRAGRGASPVPTGSLGLGRSAARPRAGAPSGQARSGRTDRGAVTSPSSAARARSRSGAARGVGTPPSAPRGTTRSTARPARPGNQAGSAPESIFRPRESSGASSRARSGRSEPSSGASRGGGVSSRSRSSGVSSRPPSSSSRSNGGVSSRPRSSGASSRPPSSSSRSSGGVSSRPRSSGASSRPSSSSSRSNGGVSSRPRSSGASSRPSSSSSRSSGGVSSRPRSSGASSRPSSSSSRSSGGVSSRPRSSGSNRSSSGSGSGSGSGSRSAARSRSGSRQQ